MWIEAVLLSEELAALVGQITPVTIRLGDNGELRVHDPSEVTVVRDLGLHVVCKATLHWKVLGLAVPLTLDSLAIMLRPAVEKRLNVEVLVFSLEIEQAKFAFLPTGIDDRIVDHVNAELEAKHVELSWDYATTFNHQFDLLDILQPVERLKLTVGGARVKASADSLAFGIEIHVDVLRGDKPREPSAAPTKRGNTQSLSDENAKQSAATKPEGPGAALLMGLVECAEWATQQFGRGRTQGAE